MCSQVLPTLRQMQEEGVAPSAITYGCALAACEALQDADLAFVLYKEACAGGVVPDVDVHNALIKVCTTAGRLDEALDEIKTLMRQHGHMQLATINSLTCALAGPCIGTPLTRSVNFSP
jgi:hypothetical protein